MGPIASLIVGTAVPRLVGGLLDSIFGDDKNSIKQEQEQRRRALEEFARAKERMLSEYLLQNKNAITNEASDEFYLERFWYVWEEIKQNFFLSFVFFSFFCIALYEILKSYKK